MNATMPAMEGGQQGSGSGFKIATVVASIIAICGIGFGVYGMMQSSNKDGQISDLKVQIANSDGTVTTIETPKVETTTNDGTVVTITDSATKDINAGDYIYVGEWGVKFKIPDNLENIEYSYKAYSLVSEMWGFVPRENIYRSSLCVTGSTSNSDGNKPTFVGLGKMSVCISKNNGAASEDEDAPWPLKVPSGEYYIQGPQAVMGEEWEWDWEAESLEAIKEMLSTENMSAI